VQEARLLAVMLRTSRLTWVFGEPGADKSALLKTGVLPLLQRRCSDFGARPSASGKFAAPDRRRPAIGRQTHPRVEAAIYFDSWGDAPLTLLKRRITQIAPAAQQQEPSVGVRLADLIGRLNQQSGVHITFLLDRFESYLAMPPEAREMAQFANELVEVVLHRDMPASFLIAMDEVARPRLERFRQRMPGFDQNFLRLAAMPELRSTSAPAAAIEVPAAQLMAAVVGRPRRRTQSDEPIKVEDIYAFIEATLAKTTTQSAAVRPAQAAAGQFLAAEPAVGPPRRHEAAGTTLATEGALAELDDGADEDSFFSHARDRQHRAGRSKGMHENRLAAALNWLRKRP